MKRTTIAALSLATVTVVGTALAVPAVAGGWWKGDCGPRGGWSQQGQYGGPGMWQGGPRGMKGQYMRGHGRGFGPGGMRGPMNNPIFQTFDENKDGTVSPDEVTKGVAALQAKYDTDKSGGLSQTEFEALHAEMTRKMAERPFRMLDADGDGQVSADEMRIAGQMMSRFAQMRKGYWQAPQPAPQQAPNN
ncbi:MAG: calcium-binding protein [Hyphomicrobiales bacterium]|nr:MAG: calcium-binding protein [Hyphomicrobiales bacterium]